MAAAADPATAGPATSPALPTEGPRRKKETNVLGGREIGAVQGRGGNLKATAPTASRNSKCYICVCRHPRQHHGEASEEALAATTPPFAFIANKNEAVNLISDVARAADTIFGLLIWKESRKLQRPRHAHGPGVHCASRYGNNFRVLSVFGFG